MLPYTQRFTLSTISVCSAPQAAIIFLILLKKPWVAGGHHVLGVEHLLGQLRHREGPEQSGVEQSFVKQILEMEMSILNYICFENIAFALNLTPSSLLCLPLECYTEPSSIIQIQPNLCFLPGGAKRKKHGEVLDQ